MLTQWDAWGRRVDRIELTAAWQEGAQLTTRHAVLASGHEDHEHARLEEFARVYLYHVASEFYTCPLAMTDGAALLMAMQYSFKAMGHWRNEREANLLDGGAPFYGTYECADGKWLALGPIEPPFHDLLVAKLGLPADAFADRWNPSSWPRLRQRLADTLCTRTRGAWCELLEGTDACVAPVLDMDEAPRHPHNVARQTFVEHAGVVQPAPAPRFSRTTPEIQRPPAQPGEHGDEILSGWGFSAGEIEALKASGAV